MTEVVLHGTKLDGPLRVWTSFPAQVEVAAGDSTEKDRTSVRCKLTLPVGVPLGIGGIVVATREGVSDLLYVMVDDLPSVADRGNNHSAEQAQEITLPAAMDGQCDGTLSDYYRFTAKAGERVSAEVLATRLGWDFDPLVRVVGPVQRAEGALRFADAPYGGKELLLADDDPSSGADSRFVFTAPADGTYLLELRDNRYKGGGRYRLRLGDFPLVSAAAPVAVQRGTISTVAFSGPRVEGVSPLKLLVPAVGGGPADVGLTVNGEAASGWAMLRATDVPVFAGVFQAPGQRDLFEFDGTKGTRVSFRAISRSVGSAAIVSLRLLNASGSQIAESPVNENDEPMLNATLSADGAYKLAVEELGGRSGADYGYAVECHRGPQFSLALKNDRNNKLRHAVAAGGSFTLDVQCQRLGYDGPIALAVDSPRLGWQVSSNVIAEKANEVKLKVTAPADFAAGELATMRIVGRAEADGSALVASMATTAALRAARPQMAYPPSWHDGMIFVSGTVVVAKK
jgi:hypothetical protein